MTLAMIVWSSRVDWQRLGAGWRPPDNEFLPDTEIEAAGIVVGSCDRWWPIDPTRLPGGVDPHHQGCGSLSRKPIPMPSVSSAFIWALSMPTHDHRI